MQGGISVNKQAYGNEPVTSRIIRKDFINDYGPVLTENGFVKKRNTFFRVHDGVFLYVALVFFSSEWTVTFAAYPFSQGYEDMKGHDGYRVSSLISDMKRRNNERSTLDSSDRSEENYQYIREQYRKAFFERAFPEFNKVTNIDAYIDYCAWRDGITGMSNDQAYWAFVHFQQLDYEKGAQCLGRHITEMAKTYQKRLSKKYFGAFEKEYEMCVRFLEQLQNGDTSGIDDYINSQVEITKNTLSGIGLIIQN